MDVLAIAHDPSLNRPREQRPACLERLAFEARAIACKDVRPMPQKPISRIACALAPHALHFPTP
ncbi:MAG: hypothetical protein ACUVWY_15160, partial [Desulfosoma sp.]|uniref:hypothetical protein n=1 Tax=Desulfosoma sp. TaxID=2603217 RepID=UPI004049B79A